MYWIWSHRKGPVSIAHERAWHVAVHLYESEFDELPESLAQLNATDGMIIDPWENPYVYETTADGSFTIVSYGSDGLPGGTDEATDVRVEGNQ